MDPPDKWTVVLGLQNDMIELKKRIKTQEDSLKRLKKYNKWLNDTLDRKTKKISELYRQHAERN